MINFDFKRTSRKCSVTGKSFQPGEEFISVLIDEEGDLIRQDIAAAEFNEPPENCIGWWKSKAPDLTSGRVYWAPKDILLSYFQHVTEQNQSEELVYVMAILLLQKKHLRLLDTIQDEGSEFMILSNSSTKEKFTVKVLEVTQTQVDAVQNELAEKLFTDIAPTEE